MEKKIIFELKNMHYYFRKILIEIKVSWLNIMNMFVQNEENTGENLRDDSSRLFAVKFHQVWELNKLIFNATWSKIQKLVNSQSGKLRFFTHILQLCQSKKEIFEFVLRCEKYFFLRCEKYFHFALFDPSALIHVPLPI